jgi:hypothetical protein
MEPGGECKRPVVTRREVEAIRVKLGGFAEIGPIVMVINGGGTDTAAL